MFGDDRLYYSELAVRKRNQETNISFVIYSLSAIMSDSGVCTTPILSSYVDGVYLHLFKELFRLSPRIL